MAFMSGEKFLHVDFELIKVSKNAGGDIVGSVLIIYRYHRNQFKKLNHDEHPIGFNWLPKYVCLLS